MADISVTPSLVAASTGTAPKQALAGATVTAGQPIYLDPAAANSAKPAKTLTAVTAAVVGIALNGASSGQPVDYVTQDAAFTVGATGATLVPGNILMLSASTAGGGITQTAADFGTAGQFSCYLGIAISTTQAKIRANAIHQSGVAHG